MSQLFEHPIERRLIRERSAKPRRAIGLMHDLESIQVVLPKTGVQMPLDADRDIHVCILLYSALWCAHLSLEESIIGKR
jgi:hypothetical protein